VNYLFFPKGMELHVNKKYGNVSSYTLVMDGSLSCSEKIELGSNEHKNKTKNRRGRRL